MIRRRFLVLLGVGVALLAGCSPPPTPTPTPVPIVVTAPPPIVTRIVTRQPPPAPTPTASPTPAYDANLYQGNWVLDMRYHWRGGALFTDVSFTGTTAITVSLDGAALGTVEFYPTIIQQPCVTAALDPEPIRAVVAGALRLAEDGQVVVDLKFVPDDVNQVTSLQVSCADRPAALQASEPIFWPMVQATTGLALTLPMQVGYQTAVLYDLSGPTGGGLRGTAYVQLQFGR